MKNTSDPRALSATLLLTTLTIALQAGEGPCPDRTVAVSVTSQDGHVAEGLTSANFRAELRGKPVDVVSAAYDLGPRRLVILLDISRSMTDEPNKWEPALIVAQDLATSAPPSISLALLTFSGQIEDRIDFTQGRKAVQDQLLKLQAREWHKLKRPRRTALLDAMDAAVSMLKPVQTGDAIYLIRHGLLATRVRVFGFFPATVVPVRMRLPEDNNTFALVRAIVGVTGGDCVALLPAQYDGVSSMTPHPFILMERDRSTILFASRGLAQEIAGFYRLAVRLPELVEKPRSWKLQVVGNSGKRNPHLRVIYPARVGPCP